MTAREVPVRLAVHFGYMRPRRVGARREFRGLRAGWLRYQIVCEVTTSSHVTNLGRLVVIGRTWRKRTAIRIVDTLRRST